MPTPVILRRADLIPSHIASAIAAGALSFKDAAEKTGLHKNALASRLAKMIHVGMASDAILSIKTVKSFYDNIDEVLTPDMDGSSANEVARLRAKLAEVQERARSAEARNIEENALADILAGIKASRPAPPSWLIDWIPSLEGKDQSVPILVLTDWHLAEVVRASEAGGYEYNTQIAKDRARRAVERTIRMTRNSLAGIDYPGIVCALGGDMISGGIHQELRETDEHTMTQSVIIARDLIIACINALRSEFGKVFVPTALGNHGRINDKRPRAKGYAGHHWDHLLYELVADYYRDDPNVCIVNPDCGETMFSVYGKTFLLTHGDMLGAKGGDGIIGAIGPVMRGSMKTLKSLLSLGHEVDHLIIGHWHQSLILPQVTVCGSMKGPDEYATKFLRAPAEDPSQMLLMVHPEMGLTFRVPIFLKDEHCPSRDRGEKNKAWVSVFGYAA